MVRICRGCHREFESKVSRVNYCNECRENGVSFICVTCGKEVTIKSTTHYRYTNEENHVWQCHYCASFNKETVKKRTQATKNTWQSKPDDHPHILNARQRMLDAHNDVEVQEKRRKKVQSDEFREMKRQQAIKQFSDTKNRELARNKSLEVWQDAEFREKQAKINKERWAEGSDSRLKASETHKALWEDIEYRNRMTEVNRANVTRPEVRAKISASIQALMGDETRRNHLSKTTSTYFSDNAELDEVSYAIVQNTLDFYALSGGIIEKLANLGAYQAVKYIRKNSRNKLLWEKIIAEITVKQGFCCRKDLALISGYKHLSLCKICRDLQLDGLVVDFRGLQNDVSRYIHSIYAGTILEDTRPSFLVNDAGNRMELDLYLPDVNLALEVNGVVWHSEEAGKDKNYHFNKSKLCRSKGIRLIHIWEHEWNNDRQRPILESMILSALGMSKRVYARKLTIEYRASATMREFFETNNIQGFRGGEFAACLVDPDTSEVLMAYLIGKGNHMSKGHKYEVIRGASKLGYTVVGGSSKLLSAIFKDKQIDDIVYYIDYNYFDGRSLRGDTRWQFVSEQVSFKNYWLKENKVKNREPGRHKEIAQKIKAGEVLTLWNAGTATYVYKKNS